MATYLAPSITEIQEAINDGRLKLRWIQHTGIFTPEKKTPIIVSRKGKKCRITLVPGYIYIPDRERQIYSRHRDIFAAIRSREHATEAYGTGKGLGEIPQLVLIIHVLVEILTRLQISGKLSLEEKKEIQQKLVDQAHKLQRAMDESKRKAASKISQGILDSIARVNPLIAQNRLHAARELLEKRLDDIGIIVPYTERQRWVLVFEARRLKGRMGSFQGAIIVACRHITLPFVEGRLLDLMQDLRILDLFPMRHRGFWARVYVKKAREAILAKDIPTALNHLRRASSYLAWKYKELTDE